MAKVMDIFKKRLLTNQLLWLDVGLKTVNTILVLFGRYQL